MTTDRKSTRVSNRYYDKASLEFSEGWRGRGVLKKIPSVGEVWIFSGPPQFVKIREYYLRLLHALVDGVEYEIL